MTATSKVEPNLRGFCGIFALTSESSPFLGSVRFRTRTSTAPWPVQFGYNAAPHLVKCSPFGCGLPSKALLFASCLYAAWIRSSRRPRCPSNHCRARSATRSSSPGLRHLQTGECAASMPPANLADCVTETAECELLRLSSGQSHGRTCRLQRTAAGLPRR
jgi:hypothetical protein